MVSRLSCSTQHAVDTATAEIQDRIIAAAANAHSGALTIRILPPGRDVLATILHSTDEDIVRLEYDHDHDHDDHPQADVSDRVCLPSLAVPLFLGSRHQLSVPLYLNPSHVDRLVGFSWCTDLPRPLRTLTHSAPPANTHLYEV